MPELQFKGKEFVYNHHLTVPYRPLVPDPEKSIGTPSLNGNLIIHGDNLHALKALLPMYAGKVDCIFIDPPYNTGNEGWSYNDNVNSPMMKEWLSSNPINAEDMLRHDKWCAMMWPRLVLLRELLSENGSFWMTLDDHEVHHARCILNEIFGEQNFIATVVWRKNYAPKSTAKHFSEDHDYVILYAKDAKNWRPALLPRTEAQDKAYKNPDNDPRGPWRPNNLAARNFYSKGTYPIDCPGGRHIDGPPSGSYWRVKEEKFWAMDRDDRIWWGEDGNNVPAPKIFRSEVKDGRVPQTFWNYDEVGHTQEAKRELLRILAFKKSDDVFITPKPERLLERIIQLATTDTSIVLDSFAGSGTTAHAVLTANSKDLGDRQFILVEGEQYAFDLTARRVQNAINGYRYKGKKKEEILREPLTWSKISREGYLNQKVADVEAEAQGKFDSIAKTIRKGLLLVTGMKRIAKKAEGLGGTFTYCTLGPELNVDAILTGSGMPDYLAVAAWLFHTATGESFQPELANPETWFLGESSAYTVWLVYRPDLEFLKSPAAALTAPLAERIAASRPPGQEAPCLRPRQIRPQPQTTAHGHRIRPLTLRPLPHRAIMKPTPALALKGRDFKSRH